MDPEKDKLTVQELNKAKRNYENTKNLTAFVLVIVIFINIILFRYLLSTRNAAWWWILWFMAAIILIVVILVDNQNGKLKKCIKNEKKCIKEKT